MSPRQPTKKREERLFHRPAFPVAGLDMEVVLMGPDAKGNYSLRGYTDGTAAWDLGRALGIEPLPAHITRVKP